MMSPETMTAVLFDRPAQDSSATSVRTVPTPRPGPGEVLIRVSHAGLNFKDVMSRRGDTGYVDRWPFVPGLESAGTIVALGPDVADRTVGEVVTAYTDHGGLAEYAVARAALTVVVPPGLDLAVAAAAPGALTTAALLIEHYGRVRDGDVVLVHSAAGAVGTAVAAIARSRSQITLIGTVGSRARVPAALAAGYDHVVVRSPRLAETVAEHAGGHGVDIVLDPQGTSQLDADLAVLAAGGRIIVFGNAGGGPLGEPAPPVGRLIGANAAIGGFSLAGLSVTRPELITSTVDSILRRLADGSLDLDVTELDGLHAVPDAQQALASGEGATKYVARLASAAA